MFFSRERDNSRKLLLKALWYAHNHLPKLPSSDNSIRKDEDYAVMQSIQPSLLWRIDPDDLIYQFAVTINKIKKYTMGGEREFAYLIADYFLGLSQQQSKFLGKVEIFECEESKRIFTVINRSLGSNEKDPRTWGDKAVLCDASRPGIYSTQEYWPLLSTHKVRTSLLLDIKNLSQRHHSNYLKEMHSIYEYKIQHLIQSLYDLKMTFSRLAKHLLSLPLQHAMKNFMHKKMGEIDVLIATYQNEKPSIIDGHDYDDYFTLLTDRLKNNYDQLHYFMVKLQNDKKKLFSQNYSYSLFKKLNHKNKSALSHAIEGFKLSLNDLRSTTSFRR
ncbi:MAG: hypothetical protein H0W64_05580 [Gammaproteobacteria bacterium]|nr:hypothetical protein [Gammaproteobacteria bacterium]